MEKARRLKESKKTFNQGINELIKNFDKRFIVQNVMIQKKKNIEQLNSTGIQTKTFQLEARPEQKKPPVISKTKQKSARENRTSESLTIRKVEKRSPAKVPGELCTTSNGSKLVFVDSTVPQTSPLRDVNPTPFTEQDEKETALEIHEPKSLGEKKEEAEMEKKAATNATK